ncbi:MAG: hypothetical protein HKN07_08565 [Acidimicrobiia bacterium]|nr:hypothetical protein [Acidimicrobiia bacterium]
MSSTTLDLLTGADFRFGLTVGLIALLVVIAASLVTSSRVPLLAGGLSLPIVLTIVLDPPSTVTLGIAALVLAGALFPQTRRYPMLPALAAVPGAMFIASAFDGIPPSWTRLYVVAVIALVSPLAGSLTNRYSGQAWGPALVGISAVGVFAAVPDTERALLAVAALFPLAFLSWPVPLASLSPAGAYGSVGALVYIISADGLARPEVLLGLVAVFGVLVAEPLARLLAKTLPFGGLASGWRAIAIVGGFHLVMAAAAARWAAQQSSATSALGTATFVVIAGAFVVYLSQPKSRSIS